MNSTPDLLHAPRVYLAGRVTGLSWQQASKWRTSTTTILRNHGVLGINPMRDTELLLDTIGPHPIPALRRLGPCGRLAEFMNTIGQRCAQDVASAHAVLVNLANGAYQDRMSCGVLEWAPLSAGTICEVGIAHGRGIPVRTVAFEDDPHLRLPVFATCIGTGVLVVPTGDDGTIEQQLLLEATSWTTSEAKKLWAKTRS